MVLADWWDRVAGRAGKREVFPSRFGEAAVYAMPAEDGSLVRMLNVGGVLQSATYLDERWATCPFAYLRSFDHLFEAALSEAPDPLVVNRVLMLGGAGFAYPKQLLLEHPGVALDVVEIDPAMVQIARERFFLDRLEMQLAAEGRADDLRIFVEDGGVPAAVGRRPLRCHHQRRFRRARGGAVLRQRRGHCLRPRALDAGRPTHG